MGQIVNRGNVKAVVNLQAIQTVAQNSNLTQNGSKASTVLANGEIWLIDTTNSKSGNGDGKYDSYIVGNGSSVASALTILEINEKIIVDNSVTQGSTNAVSGGAVYSAMLAIDVSSQISGKANKSEMSVVDGTGDDADKTTITLKSGTSATVLTQHQDISGKADTSYVTAALNGKQDTLTFDTTPTESSTNPVISGGVKTALDLKADLADMETANANISNLQDAYAALTQSAIEVVDSANWPLATLSQNTIYRVTGTNSYSDYMYDGTNAVLMATYDNAIDTSPTPNSANIITSDAVAVHGSAFDISSYNKVNDQLASYSTLSQALAAIPATKKAGGMTIKFNELTLATYSVVKTEDLESAPTGTEVQEDLLINSGVYTAIQLGSTVLPETVEASVTYYLSITTTVEEEVEGETQEVEVTTYTSWVITKLTDDSYKYVQYRLLAPEWSENIKDWQGIDDIPRISSDNLITSKGVYNSQHKVHSQIVTLLPVYTSSKVLDLATGAATSSSNTKARISDFILLNEGNTIIVDAGMYTTTAMLAIYENPSEDSFIESFAGAGERVGKKVEYTATKDVYVRFSWSINHNANVFKMVIVSKVDDDELFKSWNLSPFRNFELYNNGTLRVYYNRTQSKGGYFCVDGISTIKIYGEAGKKVYFSLLKSEPVSITSGSTPIEYHIPGIFVLEGDKSIYLNVKDYSYIHIDGSTDQRPLYLFPTIEYSKESVKSTVETIANALDVILTPENIPLTSGSYTESDYIDIEGAVKIEYKLYARGSTPGHFWDKDYRMIGIWGVPPSEGVFENEELVPPGTKYISYRTKYNTASTYYLKVYKEKVTNAQEIENKLSDLSDRVLNSGYHYLADGYGLDTTSEDNTAALQALVDLVNANGGGIIEMPKGTFNFKSGIIWRSNVSLIGQGQNVTTLAMTGTNTYSLISGDYVNNIAFKDFAVVASSMTNTSGGKALFVRYIEDGVFENLKLVDTQATSLGIDFLNRVKIINCNVINGGRGRWSLIPSGVGCSGIGIGMGWANHQENFVISNCVCVGCYNNGIFVEDQGRFGSTVMSDGTGQIIANNICRGGRNCGFSVWGGKTVTFEGNISYNNSSAGFEIGFYGQDVLMEGNQSIGNGQGFKISSITKDTSSITFANNIVKNNTTAVTIATNNMSNYITLKNNVFKGNTNGITISGDSTGLIIEGNNSIGTTNNDYTLSGTQTNAVIKNNTYFNGVTNTATFDGNSQWVELFTS